jgi:hypothetical protein
MLVDVFKRRMAARSIHRTTARLARAKYQNGGNGMDTFNAGVQYNDFKGTVAADISDNVALADYLVSLGKAESDERVVGFRIASGENRGTPVTDVSLVAYLLRSAEFEPAPAAVRAVEVRVSPGEALAFFKRFDLVATRRGVDFSGTHVDGPHYD